MSRALACVALVLAGSVPGAALADEIRYVGPKTEWLPGGAREVSRVMSASRDAPVTTLVFGPRVRAMPAADFAVAKVTTQGLAMRFGFDGFIDLEHADTGYRGLPLPGRGNGPMLWRGVYRFSFALSAEDLARRMFGPRGAIELAWSVGHESDHVTGASFDDAPRRGDILYGGGGDFVLFEAASRVPVGERVDAWLRVQNRAYVRGAILHAPGLEGGVRWRVGERLWPTLSLFAESLMVNPNLDGASDGFFAAALAGLGVRGTHGELMPFFSTDIGNGKGLLINTHELRFSIGVRYAPY